MVSVPLLVVALQVLAVVAIYPSDAGGGSEADAADDVDKRKGAADPIIAAAKGKEAPSPLQRLRIRHVRSVSDELSTITQRIRIRHARSGSDEPQRNAAMAFADAQAEGAGNGLDMELSVLGSPLRGQRQKLGRSLLGSSGGTEGSVVKDNEACWQGRGAADRDIEAGTSNDREEETVERESTLADLEAQEQEERRNASKFSYFAAGISGAGIISIFSGYLGNQTGQLHSVHLKICTFFVLATFVSAASMVLLTLLHPGIQVSIQIFKSLKYTTLVCLSFAALYVSYLFLKLLAVLAFVPTIIIFIMVIYQNRPSHSDHEGGGSIAQRSFHRL